MLLYMQPMQAKQTKDERKRYGVSYVRCNGRQMALTLQVMDRRKTHNLRDRGELGYVESRNCRSVRGDCRNGMAVKDICGRSQEKVRGKRQTSWGKT